MMVGTTTHSNRDSDGDALKKREEGAGPSEVRFHRYQSCPKSITGVQFIIIVHYFVPQHSYYEGGRGVFITVYDKISIHCHDKAGRTTQPIGY